MDRHPRGFLMRRLGALLLALVAAVCLLSAPPAAAEGGPISDGIELGCQISGGTVIGSLITGDAKEGMKLCDSVGDKGEKVVKDAWKAVWDSIVGDILRSARDTAKWVLKMTLTLGLQGPSLNLEKTGLFGEGADMQGMMIWLGWVVAAFAMMWQIGRMAITGQMKHIGRALGGFAENALITGVGVGVIGLLLVAGDAMADGMVEVAFDNDANAYDRIVKVMLPRIGNPMTLAGVLLVLLLIGIIQMVMIFLRQSAIPIQALLLPIAGAGRMGGDSTREWAPKLITSILVVIAYKPILAIIICTGFTEFGEAKSIPEFLRGLATLVLAILAPGPLMRIFEPIGAKVGGAMNVGGAVQAASAIKDLVGGGGGGGGGGAPAPTSPVEQARYLEQTMPKYGAGGGEGRGQSPEQTGGDAAAQAARNAKAGGTPNAEPAVGAGVGGAGTDGKNGTGAAQGAGRTGAGGGAAAAGGLSLTVLDGVQQTANRAAHKIGDGGNST
ncbi:hypothetical protein [Streptomyces sp. NPDC088360]|uniref:hypothetical protein n=1 Tax=Streptomyces sp. NPDC088360 TaxID=3154515 RepID=UPI0034505A69